MNSPQEFQRLFAGVRQLQSPDGASRGATGDDHPHLGLDLPPCRHQHAGAGGRQCGLRAVRRLPQRDIIQRAQQVIADDQPQIVRYNQESGLDVLLEMGCGGELEVLIEPLSQAGDMRFLDAIAQSQAARSAGFMATVFAQHDAPLTPRPQRLVWAERIVWKRHSR